MANKLARPDRSVDRFDEDPTRSFTLASSYYFDPDVYELERSVIFHDSWQYVGHISSLTSSGQYLTADISGERIFAIRTESGELRAFFNVCLHRGHSLLKGSGTVTSLITCPYHAWAYGTNGVLKGARMSDRMADFNFEDFRLAEVAVEDFCGFVFVNLSPSPTPMSTMYPGAEEAVRELYPRPEDLVASSTSEFNIAANWKNVGDNLLECYHCHPAHKAFVDLIDMSGYLNETHENWSLQAGPSRDTNNVYSIDSGAQAFASLYLWPNLSIGRFPGQRGIFLFHFEPTGPELTRQTLTYFAPDDEETEVEAKAFAYFTDVLGPEDVALVEDVQVGLRSAGYHQGRFICIPDRPRSPSMPCTIFTRWCSQRSVRAHLADPLLATGARDRLRLGGCFDCEFQRSEC